MHKLIAMKPVKVAGKEYKPGDVIAKFPTFDAAFVGRWRMMGNKPAATKLKIVKSTE